MGSSAAVWIKLGETNDWDEMKRVLKVHFHNDKDIVIAGLKVKEWNADFYAKQLIKKAPFYPDALNEK